MNALKKLFLVITISYTLNPIAVDALSTDRDQPILIEADQGQIDDARGIATYEWRVIITQGTIQINADKVTLNYSKKQDIEKVTAIGKPAQFRQQPDNSEEFLHANAAQMEYFAEQNLLELKQGAKVWQGKDVVTGEKITYDTHGGIIRAFKGDTEKSRVTVTLQPRRQ
jgi:lipopolysaccharide export system protein LptA